MNRRATTVIAAALILLAGCSLFRWSGYRGAEPDMAGDWSAMEFTVSTAPDRAHPPALPIPERIPQTLYYTDLGPDSIDVSDYPAQQKYNYEIFQRQCGRCHTLARAVSSPIQSRAYWHFHMIRMSLHSRFNREGKIPPAEMKAMLDFLDYDTRVRKVQDKKRFDDRTEELKRRFEPTLKRLLEHMQKSPQPRLIPSAPEDNP
jgi:hypothetical protein